MPSASLQNMSIPVGESSSIILMPKLQYRFRVLLENFGGNSSAQELTTQVIDVTRPNLSFEQMTLDVYNSKVNLAGKHTWEPITLNLRDDVSLHVQKAVGRQLTKQFDFYEQASASYGQNYKFVTQIEILDGGNGALGPEIIETFELFGCYLESVNYNALNYATSDAATISLTIRYDNALQTQGGNRADGIGVGGIARDIGSGLASGIGS